MDTKTRKTEALALLALKDISAGQADKLTILTAQQVGYSVRKTRTIPNPAGDIDAYGLFLNDEHIAGDDAFVGNLWAEVPDYANSVDACLTLPVPAGLSWCLWVNPAGQVRAALLETIHEAEKAFEEQPDAPSLPVAMLRDFWDVQED